MLIEEPIETSFELIAVPVAYRESRETVDIAVSPHCLLMYADRRLEA
jgi:hypothetical protein